MLQASLCDLTSLLFFLRGLKKKSVLKGIQNRCIVQVSSMGNNRMTEQIALNITQNICTDFHSDKGGARSNHGHFD